MLDLLPERREDAPVGSFYLVLRSVNSGLVPLGKVSVYDKPYVPITFPLSPRPSFGTCRDGERQTRGLELKSHEWSPGMSKKACGRGLVGTRSEEATRV